MSWREQHALILSGWPAKEFREAQHPRAADGRFGDKPGSHASQGKPPITAGSPGPATKKVHERQEELTEHMLRKAQRIIADVRLRGTTASSAGREADALLETLERQTVANFHTRYRAFRNRMAEQHGQGVLKTPEWEKVRDTFAWHEAEAREKIRDFRDELQGVIEDFQKKKGERPDREELADWITGHSEALGKASRAWQADINKAIGAFLSRVAAGGGKSLPWQAAHAFILDGWEGKGGGEFFSRCDRDEGGHCMAGGTVKDGRPQPPKEIRAARRYIDVARRRRVIKAVRNEGELASALGAVNLPDSEPADVVLLHDVSGQPINDLKTVKSHLRLRANVVAELEHGTMDPERRRKLQGFLDSHRLLLIEVKTLLSRRDSVVRIDRDAKARKERWEKKYGGTFSVVCFDDRRGGKHSGHRVYVAAGELAQSFRLEHMQRVASLADVGSAIRG